MYIYVYIYIYINTYIYIYIYIYIYNFKEIQYSANKVYIICMGNRHRSSFLLPLKNFE